MVAAEELAILLKTVPDDSGATSRTAGGEFLNSALETVEGVGVPVLCHLERFIVVIAAGFTFGHEYQPRARCRNLVCLPDNRLNRLRLKRFPTRR